MQEFLANGRLFRLCLKELRESLRDRRTIITLIMMPILVYPLLSMALQRLILGTARPGSETTEYVLGVPDEETAKVVAKALGETQRAAADGLRPSIEIIRPTSQSTIAGAAATMQKTESPVEPSLDATPAKAPEKAAFSIVVPERDTVTSSLRDGQLDIAILRADLTIQERPRGERNPVFDFTMEFRDGDTRSEMAMFEFRKAMQLVNDYQAAIFRGPRMDQAVHVRATAIRQKLDTNASLAGILPLVLILMTITGAVYPAIDLTAGERERGTMEAMIATPAPRFILLLSKYVAVVTVAVLTALANLFASWVTLTAGGLGQALLGDRGFSFWTLLQILPLLVIFAAFFSAILLAMCSFARSFKEAQSYLIPVMLVSLAPALVTLMPNIEFSTLLGIVPLINILLLSRDIMTGTPNALPAFAAVLSTLLYAGAALVVAARLFGAESATSGSQESWSDLLRRPKRMRSTPDLGELAIYMAILFPVFFVATNLAGQWTEEIQSRLAVNAVLLVVLFLIAPASFAWYRKLSFRTTFLLTMDNEASSDTAILRTGRLIGIALSAILMAGGLWIVALEAIKVLNDFGLGGIAIENNPALKEAQIAYRAIPFWMILVFTSLIPAIAEEFFFRGFVLSALGTRMHASRAIVYSAVLFGLFHVINGSLLSIERFLPTALLGLALALLAIRSGALWPGILLHAIHNGLVFWLTRFTEQELEGWFGGTNEHFPVVWIAASVIVILAGLGILFASTRHRTHEVIA